jgi:hypothetical protein
MQFLTRLYKYMLLYMLLYITFIYYKIRGEKTIEGGKEEVTQAVGDEREEESQK